MIRSLKLGYVGIPYCRNSLTSLRRFQHICLAHLQTLDRIFGDHPNKCSCLGWRHILWYESHMTWKSSANGYPLVMQHISQLNIKHLVWFLFAYKCQAMEDFLALFDNTPVEDFPSRATTCHDWSWPFPGITCHGFTGKTQGVETAVDRFWFVSPNGVSMATGAPKKRWFTWEYPINNWWFGGTPVSGNHQIWEKTVPFSTGSGASFHKFKNHSNPWWSWIKKAFKYRGCKSYCWGRAGKEPSKHTNTHTHTMYIYIYTNK